MSCLIKKKNSPVCPKSSLGETLTQETRFSYGPWYLWPSFVDCAVWLTIGKVYSSVVRSSCWERGRDFCSCFLQSTRLLLTQNALSSTTHIVYSVLRHRLRCRDLKTFWLYICCSLNCVAMPTLFLTKNLSAAFEGLWQKGHLPGVTWEQGLKWEVSEKDVHWLRTSVHTTSTCAS